MNNNNSNSLIVKNGSKPLIVVDGYGFVFRAYHVQPPLTSPDGRPVGAVYGFTSMLLKLISDFSPQEAVIVLDSGGKNFRHEIYPEYKANRPPAPDDLIEQLKLVRGAAEALNFKVLAVPGYEADDIIATLATQSSKIEKDTIIVSSDKDLLQLMNGYVKVYDPVKTKILTDEDVINKFGTGSEKLREVQALMGDKSDNIPGVKGIGPKTASTLIAEFSSVEGIYQSLDKISSLSLRKKLEDGKDDALLSWQLVGLDNNVSLDLTCDSCGWTKPDQSQIGDFLLRNGFKSLVKRAEKLFGMSINIQTEMNFSNSFGNSNNNISESDNSLNQESMLDQNSNNIHSIKIPDIENLKADFIVIKTPEQLQEALKNAEINGVVSLYLEKSENSFINSVSVSSSTKMEFINTSDASQSSFNYDSNVKPNSSLFISFDNKTYLVNYAINKGLDKIHAYETNLVRSQELDVDTRIFLLLKGFLEDHSVKKIVYDLKELIKHFDPIKIASAEDLMLMDYVLSAGKKVKSLDVLLHDYLSIDTLSKIDTVAHESLEVSKIAAENKKNLSSISSDINNKNSITEALKNRYKFLYYLIPSYYVLKQELVSKKMYKLYAAIDLPICHILSEMEYSGIKIDRKKLHDLSLEFQKKIDSLETEIYLLSGTEFNIASPKQMGEVLFEKLKLPFKKNTSKSSAYSTSGDILEKLSLEGYKIADLILEYRHLTKLKNTYTDVLPKLASEGLDRIHTTYLQNQTSTSRLSSKDPNVQNIPTRTEEGNKIRSCFIAKEGHILISADYSQIELRILSHIANIEELKKAFMDDEDIHKKTASQIFEIPIDQVDNELRRRAKAINFGIIYGISAFGLAKQLGCSRVDAASYIERYLKNYPGIDKYMKETIDFARKNGFVENMLGRRSYVEGINNANHALKTYAERAAINAPLQSLNADIVKIAMINLDDELKKRGFKTKMLLQIHDELVFETPTSEVDLVMPLIKSVMKNALRLSVPMRVDVNYGQNWQEIH